MSMFPFYIQGYKSDKVNTLILQQPEEYTDKMTFMSLGNGDYTDSESTTISLESELDGPAVCVTYDNFYLPAGYTLTTSQRCKGLYINVLGDMVVDGTISMTARGAKAAGKYITINRNNRNIYYSDSDPGDIVNCTTIPAVGACGAGGSGGWCNARSGGAGAKGTSFSGGAGGGGSVVNASGGAGAANGGSGGGGGTWSNSYGGGGAGNPGAYSGGSSGTGGLIIIFVSGNLTINGSIKSHGSKGGTGNYSGGGGGSGGGAVYVFHQGSITGSNLITTTGGGGGSATNVGNSGAGGTGGKGTISIIKI